MVNRGEDHTIASCLCLFPVLQHAPDDLDTKMKLAHAYEDLGDPARALELVNEGKWLYMHSHQLL